jgi:hypothetical protein
MIALLIAALLVVLGQAPPQKVSAIADMPPVDMAEFLRVRGSYTHLRVAVVPDQPTAIIITCDDATIAGGVRCEENWPLLWAGEKTR